LKAFKGSRHGSEKTDFVPWPVHVAQYASLLCASALLVSLGLGAVLAGLASRFSALIWVSEHKATVFGLAGALMVINGLLIWSQRDAPCPIDPDLREACLTGRSLSLKIYLFSVTIFAVGVFFAFLAPKIFS